MATKKSNEKENGKTKTEDTKATKEPKTDKEGKGSKKTDGKKKGNIFTDGIKWITGLFFKQMATGGADELRSNAEEVNQLNVFPVPDGDTGDNMSDTIDSGIAAIETVESESISEVSEELSRGMLFGAKGNSGVILSQFFAGISRGLGGHDKADAKVMGRALQMGVEQAYASVMKPTEGTILTVARESVEYAVSRINKKSTIRSLFKDLVDEMHASLDRTPELLPALKDADVVDSGAAGLFYIIDGFNRVLGGEEIADAPPLESRFTTSRVATAFDENSEMSFAYCTEALVQLTKKKGDPDLFDLDALKSFLSSLGDSIVAIKSGTIVKLHVHTMTPDRVLGYMLGFGEFLTVKIENMSLQHTDLDGKTEAVEKKPEKKHNAVVAVCSGIGIENLYRELGCDVVIQGGQTQNPSAGDFIEAFKSLNADNIFVFPNNSNIFMAAGQAAELYDGARVIVLPSKNVGSGYVALSSVDLGEEDADTLRDTMVDAMSRVTAGYISPAIRDAEMNGVSIKDGDTIGIINKEIVVADASRENAAAALATKLLNEGGAFMLTVFVGVDVTAEECLMLENRIRQENPTKEIYLTDGGQEIYPYIFVAE